MTITVAGADVKLALELGISVLIVDNSERTGLSFRITIPTKVGVSHGMNIIELLRGFIYQKEGNAPQAPDEAFLKKTIKEVILEC